MDDISQGLDEAIITNDPTGGTIPTVNSLRMQSTLGALGQKLEAYKGALESGVIPKVPSSELAFEDVGFDEGFLPNQTYSNGLDLLGLLGVEDLIEEPAACIEASPTGGTTATTFTLDASCSTDIQTATRDLQTRWDWTGDGTYDTAWATSLSTTHAYSSGGNKAPTVQVRDGDGNTASASTSVQVSDPPTACFNVSPTSGTTSTTFQFDAGCSTDDFTATSSLRVRWDWTNNGVYDTSWTTSKTASHSYGSAGTKTIKLQVQDGSALTDTTTRTVSVSSSGDGGGGGGSCSSTSGSGSGASTSGESNTGSTTQSRSGDTACSTSSSTGSAGSDTTQSASFDSITQTLEDLVDQGRPVTDPVMYQRMPNAPYEAAQPGEAWFVDGEALYLQPAAVPISALVDMQWLGESFGTHGSPAPFEVVYHDGREHARIDDPQVLSGAVAAFSPIVIGQNHLYTVGHMDMVRVDEHAMQIAFKEYPQWVSATSTRDEATDDRRVRHDRLAIEFEAPDDSGQVVYLNRAWLEGLDFTTPRFVHEDGSIVGHEITSTHYVIEPEHFSTIYVENFDDGAAQGWVLTGLWHVTSACASSYNGGYHLAYTKDSTCTYDTGTTTSGTAAFDANLGSSSPTLSFYHRWTTESYSSPYDVMRVQISTNGGTSWTTLDKWDSTDSNQGTWKYQSYSLSSYTGSAVKIRFHFDSGDAAFNDYLGWLVDNVQVSGTVSNSPPNACFSVSPSSGTTDTSFQVNAGCSSDTETSSSLLQVRWDWTNNGGYDTAWTTSKTADHSYASSGSKTIKLQVKDSGGLTDTTTKTVSVSQGTVEKGLNEDFESSISSWSLSGLWHRSSCRSESGTFGLHYNKGSCSNLNYDTGSTTSGSAVTPLFEVPSNLPVLSFKSWYYTEGGGHYDAKHVEIRIDGQTSWKKITSINDNMRQWNTHGYPLDDYAGKTVQIRFRFDSVDSVWNDYDGWVIDNVAVQQDENIVQYASPWTHSNVQGNGYNYHYRHDGSGEIAWRVDAPDDSVTQRFHLSEEPDPNVEAFVWIRGKSVDCTSQLTHEVLVNNQPYMQMSACAWPSSNYGWVKVDIPVNLLEFGTNSITFRGTCSCGTTVFVTHDEDSPGTYTDLIIGGQAWSGYEAFWYLVLKDDEEYETLERYITTEYTDENGVRRQQHAQEAYVFLDPAKRDTLHLMQREKENGDKVYSMISNRFYQRAEYDSQSHANGWQHFVLDRDSMTQSNPGWTQPQTGKFYNWIVSQYDYLVTADDGASYDRKSGSFMNLVPSNPGSSSDREGTGQNPPAYGKDSDPEFEWSDHIKLSLEFYAKTCDWKPYKHYPWDSDPHPHDCFRFAITLLDLDERSKDFSSAVKTQLDIMEWVEPHLNGLDMKNWLKKQIKSSLKGSIVGWIFGVAQTGDAIAINQDEIDREFKIPFTNGKKVQTPWTVLSTVPTIPGWIFPVDPQTPEHTILWDGAFQVEESTSSWP